MTEEKKPSLKIVSKDSDLTIKQRAFVNEIIKGKLGSYKEAYAKGYDVTLTKTGKIPKWVEVEASRLIANPKVALSLHKAITATPPDLLPKISFRGSKLGKPRDTV